MRIANNVIIDNFRKKKVTTSFDEISSSLIPFENSIEDQLIKYETKNQIKKAISKLSPSQKEIIALRMEGTSFKEIALAKNISINTALGRMRYACLNLKKKIN